jgi:hypothetical protein
MILSRWAFDLVAVAPLASVSQADRRKIQYILMEFQPATRVRWIEADDRFAIRVSGRGLRDEIAPGILLRVEELVGQPLTYQPVRGRTD